MVPQMQAGEVEAKENKPCEQGESDPDQTLLEPDPEEIAAVVISDDDEADLPINMPQAASTPKSEPALSQKYHWRTGVHACHLQRSRQQKRKRGAHLYGKQLCLEG